MTYKIGDLVFTQNGEGVIVEKIMDNGFTGKTMVDEKLRIVFNTEISFVVPVVDVKIEEV